MGTNEDENAAILRDAAARVEARAGEPRTAPPETKKTRAPIGKLAFLAGAAGFCVFMAGRYHCVTNTRPDGGFAVIRKTAWSLSDQFVNAADYRGFDQPGHERTAEALTRAGIIGPDPP